MDVAPEVKQVKVVDVVKGEASVDVTEAETVPEVASITETTKQVEQQVKEIEVKQSEAAVEVKQETKEPEQTLTDDELIEKQIREERAARRKAAAERLVKEQQQLVEQIEAASRALIGDAELPESERLRLTEERNRLEQDRLTCDMDSMIRQHQMEEDRLEKEAEEQLERKMEERRLRRLEEAEKIRKELEEQERQRALERERKREELERLRKEEETKVNVIVSMRL